MTFGFLAILAYVRYTEQPSIKKYMPVPLLMAFSLMAKPVFVTLPFLLLLFDYWPLERCRNPASLLIEKIHLFILAILFSITTYVTQTTMIRG